MQDMRVNLLIDMEMNYRNNLGSLWNLDADASATCYYTKYPFSLDQDFTPASLSNIKDSVLQYFFKLWGCSSKDAFGFFSNTYQDALFNIFQTARNALGCNAEFFFCSKECDVCIADIARLLGMEVILVDCDSSGAMDVKSLGNLLKVYAPSIIVADKRLIVHLDIGSSNMGAIDDIDKICDTLEGFRITKRQYFMHCGAFIHGFILPFTISDFLSMGAKDCIDAISCSPSAFLGLSIHSGIVVMRDKYKGAHYRTFQPPVNGIIPLNIWECLCQKNNSVLRKEALDCIKTAKSCHDYISKLGMKSVYNNYSNIVVLDLGVKIDDNVKEFLEKYKLTVIMHDSSGVKRTRLVFMQHACKDSIFEELMNDLLVLKTCMGFSTNNTAITK